MSSVVVGRCWLFWIVVAVVVVVVVVIVVVVVVVFVVVAAVGAGAEDIEKSAYVQEVCKRSSVFRQPSDKSSLKSSL